MPSLAPAKVRSRAHKTRFDWSRAVAKTLCALLAVVGVLPLIALLTLRSAWVRSVATREARSALASLSLEASFDVRVSLWPLSLVLERPSLKMTGASEVPIQAEQITVRPRVFALLAGQLVVDQIEIEHPVISLVMANGKIMNLPSFESKTPSKEPARAPFRVLSVSDGDIQLDIDGIRIHTTQLDADVTIEESKKKGTSYEIGARAGVSEITRTHFTSKGTSSVDEDVICNLDARVRIEEKAVLVHRLKLEAVADDDPKPGTLHSCANEKAEKSRVEVAARRLRVTLPSEGAPPEIVGYLEARAPLTLAHRFVPFPDSEGSVKVGGDVVFVKGMKLPDIERGLVDADGVRIDQYRFAEKLVGDFDFTKGIVRSKELRVHIGAGDVLLTSLKVDTGQPSIPLSTKLTLANVDFTALMRDLGVSEHPHVAWKIVEGQTPEFRGTLFPLKLDGELQAKTSGFAVYDVATTEKEKSRIVGFSEASLVSHVAVRADALEFQNVHARLPRSKIDGGFVHIGFDNVLRVDVDGATVDLGELGPLGSLPIAGVATTKVQVTGFLTDPHLEADATVTDFVLSDIPFGNVTAGHGTLNGEVLTLREVAATKGKSTYEMPTARLDFGGPGAMTMDASVSSSNFEFKDFLALWHMEDDPRFSKLDMNLAPKAQVHVALGGPEDRCGGGFLDIDAHAHLTRVELFDEKFDEGDLDLDYEWNDRLAGVYGARIEVHTIALRKARAKSGGEAIGNVLGSAMLDHGDLHGSVILEGIPLSRVQMVEQYLPATAKDISGSASGIAHVSGTIDAYAVNTDLDISPLDIRGAKLPSSRVHVTTTQIPTAKNIGKTRCGGPISAPFDKIAYLRDGSSQGDNIIDGELFGGQVTLKKLTFSRQEDVRTSGDISFTKLDIGNLLRASEAKSTGATQGDTASATKGVLSGLLHVEEIKKSRMAKARATFTPTELVVSRGGSTEQEIRLAAKDPVIRTSDGALLLPELPFRVTNRSLAAELTLRGSIKNLGANPDLALEADLTPLDLGLLVGVVPRLDRASGTLVGNVRVAGTLNAPKIDGAIRLRNGELAVRGTGTSAGYTFAAVTLDSTIDSKEFRVDRASTKFAGGTLEAFGAVPFRGGTIGSGEFMIRGRDLQIPFAEGISTAFDTDLRLQLPSPDFSGTKKKQLPVLSGDITLDGLEYSRPITIDYNQVGRKGRTEVEVYDPAFDSLAIELRVQARRPLRIRNNLADLGFRIGGNGLLISGTNQRFGLRGELKAETGGKIQFLQNQFEIKDGQIRFDDPTRIQPTIDVRAQTVYRRSGVSSTYRSSGQGRAAGQWRIDLHAYGDPENLRIDKTSDPPLSDEDITLLLTLGITRAELSQVQAGDLIALATSVSGADRAVKSATNNLVDDFNFGGGYSTRTGRTVPQVTIGKRISDNVRTTVTAGLAEDRELRANIEWRLGQRVSLQGSYDNVNDASSSPVGNLGVDLSWRIDLK